MNKIDENKFDSKKIKVSIFDNLLNSIAQNQSKIKVKGISGSSISVLIHKLFKKLDRPIFYLTNDSEKSSYIYTDLYDTIEKKLNYFPSRFRKNSNKLEENIENVDYADTENGSISDELIKLNDLFESEVITKEEFEKAKKKLLDK